MGEEGIRCFYSEKLIGQSFPEDVEFIPISRTIDGERLVDEVVIKFTHTQRIEHLLPDVEPTGREVTMAVVVIVGFREGNVSYEHIYSYQAVLLVQLSLLNPLGISIDPTVSIRFLQSTGHFGS